MILLYYKKPTNVLRQYSIMVLVKKKKIQTSYSSYQNTHSIETEIKI